MNILEKNQTSSIWSSIDEINKTVSLLLKFFSLPIIYIHAYIHVYIMHTYMPILICVYIGSTNKTKQIHIT